MVVQSNIVGRTSLDGFGSGLKRCILYEDLSNHIRVQERCHVKADGQS